MLNIFILGVFDQIISTKMIGKKIFINYLKQAKKYTLKSKKSKKIERI